jgi:hypothetical protein
MGNVKKLIFISKGMEEGDAAAYIEKMADQLKADFQKHDLEDFISSSTANTLSDQWVFFRWPLTRETEELLDVLKLGHYLLYDNSQGHDPEFISYLEKDTSLICPIDTSRDFRFHIPLLRGSSSSKSEIGRKDLEDVGENLNDMIQFSLEELQRVKRLHEKVVPMKNDNFKGVQILSKFAAGEGAGGEFFDIVKGDQEVLLLLTNTSSYVASSIILSHFERLRAYHTFGKDRIEHFIGELSSELKELELLDTRNSDSLQILIAKIDLSKMKIEGFQYGKTEMVSSKGHYLSSNKIPLSKEFLEKAKFGFDLERGERIVISSPGVRQNCGGFMDSKKYEDFIKERLPLGPRELLNEVYFQLKKSRESDFLQFDASVIYLEVDKNVIIEV